MKLFGGLPRVTSSIFRIRETREVRMSVSGGIRGLLITDCG
jgi:hypothetical protein